MDPTKSSTYPPIGYPPPEATNAGKQPATQTYPPSGYPPAGYPPPASYPPQPYGGDPSSQSYSNPHLYPAQALNEHDKGEGKKYQGLGDTQDKGKHSYGNYGYPPQGYGYPPGPPMYANPGYMPPPPYGAVPPQHGYGYPPPPPAHGGYGYPPPAPYGYPAAHGYSGHGVGGVLYGAGGHGGYGHGGHGYGHGHHHGHHKKFKHHKFKHHKFGKWK